MAVRETEIPPVTSTPGASYAAVTVGLCLLAALAEGFDNQSMGVAAPTMAPALHLARDQLGPAFSATTVGLLVGAIALGYIADHVGRKSTLIASLAIFGVFSLATAAAPNYAALLVIRVFAGLGLGGAMPNIVALASESVSAARRARMVALASAGLAFGAAVAALVAGRLDWRALFIVGGVAPLAIAVIMAMALPESSQFLAARAAPRTERADIVRTYFGGGRAFSTLLLWIGAFATLLTLYLLTNWLPTLMAAKGMAKSSAALVSLFFNVGAGLGSLAIAGLFGGHRRGPTYAIWFVGVAVGVTLLAFAGADLAWTGADGFVAGFFIGSIPMSFFALAPDFYGVGIRAAGVGGAVGAGRVGGIVGPAFAGVLFAGGQHPSGVILALLPFVALAAIATFALLVRRPEV